MQKAKKITFLSMLLVFLLAFAGSLNAAENMITKAKANRVSSGAWKETSKGRRYRGKDGKYLKDVWCTIGGKIYYFNTEGYAKKGWVSYKGETYYEGKDGAIAVKQWIKGSKNRYYVKKDGTRASAEWQKISGKYYYFNAKGVMAKGKQVTTGGKTYYVNEKGERQANSWVLLGGKLYFFGADGVRFEDTWVRSGGKYYYLQVDGSLAKNMWVGEYYVGANGVRKTNCVVDGYYLDAGGKRTKVVENSIDCLIVGDSRVVGMESAVPVSRTKFIGKVSMGYSWLISNAGPKVRQYLAGNQKLKVVFAFGINDLANSSLYISYYQKLVKDFPKAKLFFLSVNPVDERKEAAHGYKVKNREIETFNTAVAKAFPAKFLDCYAYLTKKGFSTADGVHYTADTYRDIYSFILNHI